MPLPTTLVKLEKWAIAFLSEAQLGGKPASCFTCHLMYARQKTCSIIGPGIIIDRWISSDGKRYTPTCSALDSGTPLDVPDEEAKYDKAWVLGPEKADAIGLEWAEGEGTNCGGKNGGAPCTKHYTPEDEAKGGCRPLQVMVGAGDCCGAHNGPSIAWRNAQALLRNIGG
jgi:hypothetical protein